MLTCDYTGDTANQQVVVKIPSGFLILRQQLSISFSSSVDKISFKFLAVSECHSAMAVRDTFRCCRTVKSLDVGTFI